jgi:hypothetical protein
MRTQQQHRPSRTASDHERASEGWWAALDGRTRKQLVDETRRELGRDASVAEAFRRFNEAAGDRQLHEPAGGAGVELAGDALAVEVALYALVADGVAGVREALAGLRPVPAAGAIVSELEEIERRMMVVAGDLDSLGGMVEGRGGVGL